MVKTLTQACCGPCSLAVVQRFGDYTFFFNGDNFDSIDEYKRRLDSMLRVDAKTIVEPYNPKIFNTCEECIGYRLSKCAEYAKEHGFDGFSTTLTVSPHKDTGLVNKIGCEAGEKAGIPFIQQNLKENGGFMKTVTKSKEMGLYRQKYCGCKKSVRQ